MNPRDIIRSAKISSLLLQEIQFPAKISIPMHSHPSALFCISLSGSCVEVYGNQLREYQPFTLEYLPMDHPHSLKVPLMNLRAFSVEIPPSWLDRIREYSLIVDQCVYTHRGLLGGLFMNLYKEFREMDTASPVAIEGVALEMLAEASRSRKVIVDRQPPPWLKQALDLLQERFSDHLTITEIATTVGIHPVHLTREFRKFHRCTIGDYIRKLRIEQACNALAHSDSSLAQIALSAGFSDHSHFSRIFKRFMRVTPTQYRAASCPRKLNS
ncbi:AraC family transcriptional regulator [bacterium]|nr:AraC family transcriptional regulator [bacterium]